MFQFRPDQNDLIGSAPIMKASGQLEFISTGSREPQDEYLGSGSIFPLTNQYFWLNLLKFINAHKSWRFLNYHAHLKALNFFFYIFHGDCSSFVAFAFDLRVQQVENDFDWSFNALGHVFSILETFQYIVNLRFQLLWKVRNWRLSFLNVAIAVNTLMHLL